MEHTLLLVALLSFVFYYMIGFALGSYADFAVFVTQLLGRCRAAYSDQPTVLEHFDQSVETGQKLRGSPITPLLWAFIPLISLLIRVVERDRKRRDSLREKYKDDPRFAGLDGRGRPVFFEFRQSVLPPTVQRPAEPEKHGIFEDRS